MVKKKRLTLLEAQPIATRFIAQYIGSHPLGLPATMNEAAYQQAMGAITRAMYSAWADGFAAAQGQSA